MNDIGLVNYYKQQGQCTFGNGSECGLDCSQGPVLHAGWSQCLWDVWTEPIRGEDGTGEGQSQGLHSLTA